MTRAEERARKAASERRRRAEGKVTEPYRYGAGRPSEFKGHSPSRATREEISARLAEIPPDTRTPIQIMLGDPPFERSALGRERPRQ